MFSPDVYINRRKTLKQKVSNGLILLLGNNDSPMNYPANGFHFRQDSTFLYYFGLNLQGMAAIIDPEAGETTILANDVDIDDIIWMGPQPSVKELALKCGVTKSKPFAEIYSEIEKAIKSKRKIHFLPPYRHDNMILLHKLLGIGFDNMKSEASLELINAVVSQRNIKEDCEIEEINKACNIGYLMHTTAMKMAKDGVVEREIAGI
ncbi:MAG: aminopeptidase P family protein, partial [Bacteroidales bacterium]|nr:aminopeptidase P family protein [Bacteroidales bacterium]